MMNVSNVVNMPNITKLSDMANTTNTVPPKGNDTGISAEVTNVIKNVNAGKMGDSGSSENSGELTEEESRIIKNAIDQANEKVKNIGMRQLAFSYNESTKRISIKVYDALTKEVIREIPPEKTEEMLERIYDLAGILVDEKR